MPRTAVIVPAGGAGHRLGGVAKPALRHAGWSLLGGVVNGVRAAVPGAVVVVVGPEWLRSACGDLPGDTRFVLEDPPGAGPAAALAAGVAALPAEVGEVLVLAADLVGPVERTAIALADALAGHPAAEGIVAVDGTGRRQWLASAWRAGALRGLPSDGVAGWSLQRLLGGLKFQPIAMVVPEDVDDPTDLERHGIEVTPASDPPGG